MVVAIVSPGSNSYSETFIQAHRKYLKGEIHFLYKGSPPAFSEFTNRSLISSGKFEQILFYLNVLFEKKLTVRQLAFKNYLKKHKVQCVLAEYGTAGVKVYEVCKDLNIPFIVHFHGYDAAKYDVISTFKEKYREMFQYASYVISVSKGMNQQLTALGVSPEKLVLNTYGPNDEFVQVERQKTNEILFFAAGRFVEKKAPYYTIYAFNEVLKSHPEAKLVIGGDGPLWEACLNLIKILGIERSVELPGVLTLQQIKKYLSEAVAFVQHSVTALDGDMEGTPLSILEASASGVPVISTNHAGIPDVIVHEKTGLLCAEHDYKAMADNMLYVIDRPEIANKMGIDGKKNIIENFSMKPHIMVIDDLIAKAIRNNNYEVRS